MDKEKDDLEPILGKDGKHYRITQKQTEFARLLVFGHPKTKVPLTQSEAYKIAYNCKGSSTLSVYRNASVTASNPKVKRAIEQFQAMKAEYGEVTLSEVVTVIREAIEMAREERNPAVLAASAEKLAKITGIDAPKRVETTVQEPPPKLPSLTDLINRHKEQKKAPH